MAPKYQITGDTIEEMAIAFAELTVKTGRVEVRDNKSGKAKYGVWALNDGMGNGPFDQGLHLSVEQAKTLNTGAGAPAVLSVDVVLRQLTPLAAIPAKIAASRAATSTRIEALKAQLARLESAR